MSILTEADVPSFRFDVDSVSKRALTKPVHQTISISGQSGSYGYSGTGGTSGSCGFNGMTGCQGGSGSNGTNGSAAESGRSGTDSQHALIRLNGTVENVNMQLKSFKTLHTSYENSDGIDWNIDQHASDACYDFQLANSKGIILVRAVGGNGGEGGHGGKGGDGGSGGCGGSGAKGTDGHNASSEGARGDSGGQGESGGSGGCGGNGGNGGDGGKGGNAGAGGHVQVRSADPQLFMLIELDCRAGKRGNSGSGGAGGSFGSGGKGGSGGEGGSGGSGGDGGSSGSSGMSGSSGQHGSSGNSGRDGSSGHDGRAASGGSIQYAVVDSSDNITETGSDKYHASVTGYTMTDENNDGIYEPNSDFYITNVRWTNSGAITLPSGSILSFPSTEYISNDINDVSELSNAAINQTLLDSHRFKCHLNTARTVSINEPYIHLVKITSEINLLNRLFSGSTVSTTFTCQYPIQITNIAVPTFLGPNERAIVTVSFTNISAQPYGTCSGSAGSIEFILSTHSSIKILPVNAEYFYQIMPDACGRYKINDKISPQSTKRINFEITLEADAFNQLYESLFWKIELLLRDILIEQRTNNIRVVPSFRPNIHTDVLLVTNAQVGRTEFLAYQNLFQLFKYSSQTWDIERYGALHHPEITWLNTTDLVIFIYLSPQSTFNTIKSQLFLQHMSSSENAGFICIGACRPNEFDFALFDYNNLQFIDIKQKTKSEATNHLWSGIGFGLPDAEEINVKANKIRANYEKQEDHQFLYQVVYDDTIDRGSSHCMTVIYGNKYVYKSTLNSQVGNRLIMVTSGNPLLVSSHLPFKLQDQPNTNQQSNVGPSREHKIDIDEMDNKSQNQDIIQDDISLNSQFGRLLCAILFYQGFEKSHLIITENYELARCTFTAGSNKFSFQQILVSLGMSIIEHEYDRGGVEFQSSAQLVTQAANVIRGENNASSTNNHGADKNNWLYLLIQSLYEHIDRKFWSSFPWCGCTKKAKQRHKLEEILGDLLALSTDEIPRDKEMDRTVQMLRLQKLAKLTFPAADTRENCARQITEIQPWKEEQKIKEIQSSTPPERY